MSLNKAKAVAQRKILAAAQSREANMALVLVCTVLMFIICHAPKLFISRYVNISDLLRSHTNHLKCNFIQHTHKLYTVLWLQSDYS